MVPQQAKQAAHACHCSWEHQGMWCPRVRHCPEFVTCGNPHCITEQRGVPVASVPMSKEDSNTCSHLEWYLAWFHAFIDCIPASFSALLPNQCFLLLLHDNYSLKTRWEYTSRILWQRYFFFIISIIRQSDEHYLALLLYCYQNTNLVKNWWHFIKSLTLVGLSVLNLDFSFNSS